MLSEADAESAAASGSSEGEVCDSGATTGSGFGTAVDQPRIAAIGQRPKWNRTVHAAATVGSGKPIATDGDAATGAAADANRVPNPRGNRRQCDTNWAQSASSNATVVSICAGGQAKPEEC